MKIKHVYGNVLRIDIPLTIKIRTIEEGTPSEREEPFYPDATKGCIVELANNYNRKIQYDATVSGNVAHIEDDGIISIGTYKVTVKCHDEYGNPYRYMVRDIVEICDATIDAGIEAGVEFNAETYTLDGAVFVSYGVEQVQSDWNEQDDESKAYIKNKPDLTQYATKNELREVESEIPTLPDHIVTDGHYVHTDNNYTTEEKQKLANAITEEQDPTVPQWAKQPNKPSYTPQEVGALPANTPLFDGDYNSLTNKPDLSGYITISVNNLVNYYLKSEVYTKTEVANLIAAIQQFHYEIYASTSAVTSPAGNVLYLIGPTGTGADKYEEYVYDATKQEPWVKIGDTSIDLSGYYTSQQTDAAITSALNTALADYTTTANLTTLLAGKQDVINDLAAIRSGAQAGATAVQPSSLAEVATSGSYNDLSDKPDLSAFITRSVDDLVNYYLKSETYTKAEVQQLIGAIQQFHYEVYPTLPQTGTSNVLYLIGPTGSGSDKYEEYVYTNNDWTKIGDTSIDLSGYVTTEALNTALADYVTSSALSTALAGKEDVTTIVTPVNATDATLPITTLTCEVGKYYRIGVAVDTLGVTLPAMTDLTTVRTVVIYLTAGTTPAVTITAADNKNVYYQDGFEIEAGNTYEINALFNGAAWIVAAVKINVE